MTSLPADDDAILTSVELEKFEKSATNPLVDVALAEGVKSLDTPTGGRGISSKEGSGSKSNGGRGSRDGGIESVKVERGGGKLKRSPGAPVDDGLEELEGRGGGGEVKS